MIDLSALKQAARIVTDEKGERVVQIPLPVWQEYVGNSLKDQQPVRSKNEEILALLHEWHEHPEDDKPPEWWDEFDQFLRENRFNIPERDLGLNDT